MNQSALPDFQCSAYRRQAPTWRYLDDLYQGSSSWLDRSEDGSVSPNAKASTYIPQFSKEDPQDYKARIIRTPYSDRFAQALRDFVGLIFHNEIRYSDDFPPILVDHLANLDQEGSSSVVLFSQMALASMRRGHSFVLIDCPSHNGSLTLADRIRPYWVHIHAHQVLSWRSSVINGKRHLSQIVIRQCQHVPSGAFGEVEEVSYLILTPGHYNTFTIAVNPSDKTKKIAVHHPDRSGVHGIIRGGQIQPFNFIPLVPLYGGLQTGFFESMPALKTLGDLNLTHYQMYSDHLSKIHYCCFPTPVRVGVMGDEDELVLGPGVTVDVSPGGAFLWAEPSATSIAESRKEIEALELAMDFLGTQYLVKPSDRQAAMVSLVQAAKVESSLDLFANSFQQGLNQAIAIHCAYLGIAPGTIQLDTKFFQQGNTDPNLLQGYVSLYDRLLSMPQAARSSLLKLAQRRGYIPSDLDVEAELSTLPQTTESVHA